MRQHNHVKCLGWLLCFVLVISFASCTRKQPDNEISDTVVPSGEESASVDTNGEQTDLSNENDDGKYLVRFLTDEGIPISILECNKGETLIPPTPPRQIGRVFAGWEGDYRNISNDVDILAQYVDISKTKNVINADTIYTVANSEFDIVVGTYGDVGFCGLDMNISYDSDLLELIETADVDDCVILNDSQKGIVHLNYVTTSNTTGEVVFMTLKFKSKTGTQAETGLQMQVNSMYVLDSNDALIPVEYQVLSNRIIICEVDNET